MVHSVKVLLVVMMLGIVASIPIAQDTSQAAIPDTIDFSDTTFNEKIDWEYWRDHPREGITVDSFRYNHPGIAVSQPITFLGAIFNESVDFTEAIFDSVASFNGADFHDTAYFRLAKFQGPAEFASAIFDSVANFYGTEFHDEANFLSAEFHRAVQFLLANFESVAVFRGTEFHDIHFIGTSFGSKVDFRNAKFFGKVNFFKTYLPDYIDLRQVTTIEQGLDFSYARLGPDSNKCRIALAGADIRKISFQTTLFDLWFPVDTTNKVEKIDDEYGQITILDSASYPARVRVYEQVLKKMKDDGSMVSYQDIDIEYQQLKYNHDAWFSWSGLNFLQEWWWNYGYSKFYVFGWTFGLWAFFSLINIFFLGKLQTGVYKVEFLRRLPGNPRYLRQAPWFHIRRAVTYTATVFFGLKMDISKFKKGVVRKHPWLFAYLIFSYGVGLVCLGFIANIVFTKVG